MSKIKKATTLTLSLLLMLNAVACSNNNNSKQKVTASTEKVKVDTNNNIFSADLDDYKGSGETLSMYTVGGAPEDHDKVFAEVNKYLKEHLNVNINLTYFSWGEYGTNMNTKINGGEYYDMTWGPDLVGVNDFARDGLFYDVSKLLPAAPNLKALIPDTVWKGVTLGNGSIFGVPTYKDSSATQYWIYDKEYLTKSGMDEKTVQNVKTLEDLDPIVEEMKKKNPDTNPMLMTSAGIQNLNYDYELVAGPGPVAVKFGTTEVVNLFKQDEVKRRFELLHKWYSKEIINQDFVPFGELDNSQLHIWAAQGYPGVGVQWERNHNAPIVSVPRLGPMFTTTTIQGSYWTINAAAKYPVDAIKVLERINVDPYLRNLMAYGIEGEHYKFVDKEKNIIVKTDNGKYDPLIYQQGQFMNLYTVAPQVTEENAKDYPNLKIGDPIMELANPNQWQEVHEVNKKAEVSKLLGFIFDPSNVETEISALNNVTSKYFEPLHTGKGNTDEILPKMLQEMEQIGIDKVIKEAQKQIDEFLAKK